MFCGIFWGETSGFFFGEGNFEGIIFHGECSGHEEGNAWVKYPALGILAFLGVIFLGQC